MTLPTSSSSSHTSIPLVETSALLPEKQSSSPSNSSISLTESYYGTTSSNMSSRRNDSLRSSAVVVSLPKSLEENENQEEESVSLVSTWATVLEIVKYTYSGLLLVFSVVLIAGSMMTHQTIATAEQGWSPLLTLALLLGLLLWLSALEGTQGSLVGLQPMDPALYQDSHPWSYQSTALVHSGSNMERFIMGRQFLVVLVVFLTTLCSQALPTAQLWHLPEPLLQVFIGTGGVALMLWTIQLGQLMSQINASDSMLDLTNHAAVVYGVTYPSLWLEWSGLLHVVYLFAKCFDSKHKKDSKEYDTNETANVHQDKTSLEEAPRTTTQSLFYWARVLFSCAVLTLAWAVTLTALAQGTSGMGNALPPLVNLVLLVLFMGVVGFLEGLQIAFFALAHVDDLSHAPLAQANCEDVFQGQHLAQFLIGRQMLVTICMFVVAKFTSVSLDDEADDNLWGVSNAVQAFFNTGLLGAVLTTVHASLLWRVIAAAQPLLLASSRFVAPLVRVCWGLEQSGLCAAAWILARWQKQVMHLRPDHDYLDVDTPDSSAPDVSASDKPPSASPPPQRRMSRREVSSRSVLSISRNSISRRDALLSSSMRIAVMAPDEFELSQGAAAGGRVMSAPQRRTSVTSSSGGRRNSSSRQSRRDMILSARAFSTANICFDDLPNDDDDEEEGLVVPPLPPLRNAFGTDSRRLLAVGGVGALDAQAGGAARES